MQAVFQPENAQILQNGPIYSFGSSLLHDTRDLILDPVAGGFQSLSLQVGAANLKPPPGTTPAVNSLRERSN